MITTLYSGYNEYLTKPCQWLWEKSFSVRHKIRKVSQLVFDQILPHSSLIRYISTDFAPKVLKIGCQIVVLPTSIAYSCFKVGHLVGNQWESGHGQYLIKEIIYDEILGAIILTPIVALGVDAILTLKNEGKKAINELAIKASVTALLSGLVLANWTIGHYTTQYLQGASHAKVHGQDSLITIFITENAFGAIPSMLLTGGVIVAGGGIIIVGSCLKDSASGVKTLMQSEFQRYQKWKQKELEFIEMEKGQELKRVN